MIYARSNKRPQGLELPLGVARLAACVALIGYPAGALIRAFGPDTLGTALTGFGLILLSLVAAAALVGSSVQRIAAEQTELLSERELLLRYRATSRAFGTFAGLTLAALFYAAVASDKGLWLPYTYEQYNGVFWGAFLYATLLPSTFVAWMLQVDEQAPE